MSDWDPDILIAARRWYGSPNDETLEELKEAVRVRFAPIPDNLCSWCGKSDSENEEDGFGRLVPVSVSMADGQEGQACITQWLCNDHLIFLSEEFQRLRFVDHNHGGANFLEDVNCPGFENLEECPSPSGYGEFVVSPSNGAK
jgi:hypothetical protein